jgi:predicted nuclease of restriction endonuclease-like RecB superfamily
MISKKKWLTFRSGLEDKHSKQIEEAGLEVLYETDRYNFEVPARKSRYTPDFKLPKKGGFFYIESKGIWDVQSRQKHLLLKEQYGDKLDIRFVFSNQNARLYKKSPTTYAAYCEKHGFQYAHKVIPQIWLDEALDASAA